MITGHKEKYNTRYLKARVARTDDSVRAYRRFLVPERFFEEDFFFEALRAFFFAIVE
jgi:hypothetical protein